MLSACLGLGTTASADGDTHPVHGIGLDCDPAALAPPQSTLCTVLRRNEGRRLFTEETFGGNGRTCETCHSETTGTFSPPDAFERYHGAGPPA